MVVCALFAVTFLSHGAAAARPSVMPTEVCSCPSQGSAPGPGASPFRGHGPPSSTALYDEQIGLTLTQSFTSIEYNVTAVEQTDPTLQDGPAYLLNGLSNAGYWYQVGVSWDWAPGESPGTGFDMNYEVFDNAGNSIFPSNDQGGLDSFSGPVNDGDTIILDLYFSTSTQSVVMIAEDANTGATASETYPDMGAVYFEGLPSEVANQNGYFTGLMTEWYHGAPYYANEAEVIYSNPYTPISSAWMWVDEFNANTMVGLFSTNTSTPVSYTDPTKLQEFSFNGTTEYSDASEFVTGALTNQTLTPTTVPLTLSFEVTGGGSGYSAPQLEYVSNGTSRSAALTTTPTVYQLDPNSTWTVDSVLAGSTSSVRFETDQNTSGEASAPTTLQFDYYTQYAVTFGFTILGGGSGLQPPSVSYTSFGDAVNTSAGVSAWVDGGTSYSYATLLRASTASERWYSTANGTVDSPEQVVADYYHQFLDTFELSFMNTEVFPSVTLTSTSGGHAYSATLILGANTVWLDSGANYSLPQSFSLEGGERLITNGTTTGSVSSGLVDKLAYDRQFYIQVEQNSPNGGTVSPTSGWYDSGSVLSLDAQSASGWQFEGWTGGGTDSVSSSNASVSLTVGPGSPANETATFYPGVTISAHGPDSVSYQDGTVSGTVNGGTSSVVFVPPGTNLTLKVSNTAFLASFSGWTGSVQTKNSSVSFGVDSPASVTSNSEYGYDDALVVVVVVVAAMVIVALALSRRRSRSTSTVGRPGGPSPEAPTGN